MEPKRVLLWVFLDSHFREMIRVARLLKARTALKPVFLFEYHYPRFSEDIAVCVAEGFEFVDLVAGTPGSNTVPCETPTPSPTPRKTWKYWGKARRFMQRVYQKIRRSMQRVYQKIRQKTYGDFFAGLGVTICLNHYRNLLHRARSVLDHLKPVLMVFPEDNVEYNIPTFVKAARERNIPSLVIPYTIANAREPAEAYWDNPRHHVRGLWRQTIALLFPHWVYSYRGRRLLRLTAEHIVAQQWHKLSAPLPWILNSGFSSVIAMESEAIRQYYLRAGLPPWQLKVLGSIRQDELFRHRKTVRSDRQKLLRSLGWEDDRPVILCALPPNQRPENRPGCEFQRYEDLLEFWAKTLGSLENCHVIVNPHPRIPFAEVEHLEQWGIRIVREDIARLIPLCDIFVASVSATICMALACDKPVINYDVYRFRYDDFENVAEVTTIETGTEFSQTLQDALVRLDFPSSVTQNQTDSARHWGLLDGKAGDRLIALVAELTSTESVRLAA